MSVGKITEQIKLGKGVVIISRAELEKQLVENFHKMYGRWESVSGKKYLELYHESPDTVFWKTGTENGLEEDLVLTRREAIPRFKDLLDKGFARAFEAVTAEDIAREMAKYDADKSFMARTFRLGTYRKDNHFLRVNEFVKGEYYLEYGIGLQITKGVDADEKQAVAAINAVLNLGYKKDGKPPVLSGLEAFFAPEPAQANIPSEAEEVDEMELMMADFYK